MKRLFSKKTFKIIACIMAFLVVGYSIAAAAFPVSVANWPVLMQMIKQQVSQHITNTMQDIWARQLNIKRMPGNMPDVTRLFIDQNHYAENLITREWGGKYSSFAPNHNRANAELNSIVARDEIRAPTSELAVTNPQEFDRRNRETSRLIIGSRQRASTGTPTERYLNHKRDILTQYNVMANEQGGEAVKVASRFKEEIKKQFSPGAIDGGLPEQAVKDLAKLMYYNALLQAEILKTMGKAEQRNAVLFK